MLSGHKVGVGGFRLNMRLTNALSQNLELIIVKLKVAYPIQTTTSSNTLENKNKIIFQRKISGSRFPLDKLF